MHMLHLSPVANLGMVHTVNNFKHKFHEYKFICIRIMRYFT